MQCIAELLQSTLQSRGLAELGHEDQAHSPGAAHNNIADGRLSGVTVFTRRCHQISCLISYGVLTSSVCLVAAHHEATPRPQQDLCAPRRQSGIVAVVQTHRSAHVRAGHPQPLGRVGRSDQTYLKCSMPSTTIFVKLVEAEHRRTAKADCRHLCAIDNGSFVMLHAKECFRPQVTTPHDPRTPWGKVGTAGLHYGTPY